MKKFLLGILLPVLTLVTLIGTGFATWYFNETTSQPTDASVNTVEVTGYAAVGQITLNTNATKITLDQPKTGVDGIALDKEIKATYAPLAGTVQTVPGKLKVTVTIPKTLEGYIKLTTGWTKGATDTSGTKYTKDTTFNSEQGATLSIAIDEFKYVETQVPKDKKAYDALVSAASGAKISVAFVAELDSKK